MLNWNIKTQWTNHNTKYSQKINIFYIFARKQWGNINWKPSPDETREDENEKTVPYGPQQEFKILLRHG